jgi:hypothetical protein
MGNYASGEDLRFSQWWEFISLWHNTAQYSSTHLADYTTAMDSDPAFVSHKLQTEAGLKSGEWEVTDPSIRVTFTTGKETCPLAP